MDDKKLNELALHDLQVTIGRKQLQKVIAMVAFVAISVLALGFFTNNLDISDGVRSVLEVLLFYFVYQGKEWARKLSIFLFGAACLLVVAFSIAALTMMPIAVIPLGIMFGIYGYAVYKLMKDEEIKVFLAFQRKRVEIRV